MIWNNGLGLKINEIMYCSGENRCRFSAAGIHSDFQMQPAKATRKYHLSSTVLLKSSKTELIHCLTLSLLGKSFVDRGENKNCMDVAGH